MADEPRELLGSIEEEPLEEGDFRKDSLWGFRLSHKPVAALVLCAVLVALHYLLNAASGDEPERTAFYLVLAGAKVNSLIDAGEWWRLVSSVFLHASFAHLAVNCLGVLIAGWLLENFLGAFQFTAIFVLSAVTGGVASFFLSPMPSAGASGGMFGLLGGTVAFGLSRYKDVPRYLRAYVVGLPAAMALFSFGYGLMADRVDNFSHAGGFFSGAALVPLFSFWRTSAGSTFALSGPAGPLPAGPLSAGPLSAGPLPAGPLRLLAARLAKTALVLVVLYSLAAAAAHVLLRFDLPASDLGIASTTTGSRYYFPNQWERGVFSEGRCALDSAPSSDADAPADDTATPSLSADAPAGNSAAPAQDAHAPARNADPPIPCHVDPFYSIYLVAPSSRMINTPVFAEHVSRQMGHPPGQYPNDTILWSTDERRSLTIAMLILDDLSDKYAPLFAALRVPPPE